MTVLHPGPDVGRAVPFWDLLRQHGDAPALHAGDATLTYADLADRVEALAAEISPTGVRRLAVVAVRNDVDMVVAYLACLAGRHPVALVDADNPVALDALVATYDPDVVLASGALTERRTGSAHDLHPDLALLLSTSGSTGSPKLVRLSHRNLASNAAAIADYLGIRPTDVAATTLPLHYTYGLSVLHSHLAAGASVLLTELSVVDPCFWDAVDAHRVTTFPGVPHTFDLLDRVGFAAMDVPSLRYLTSAGGRLAPETVRRYAELGRRRGFDLVVMYGATEATARMAYLPADLAMEHAGSIGVAIPGGSLSLADVDPETAVGELVYRGDNVMLGYAEVPADLARGAEHDALRTGDLARRTPAGLFEIVGRAKRFAKVFGLRVDLDHVERSLAAQGIHAVVADGGDRVVVGVDVSARPVDETLVRSQVGLPASAVDVVAAHELPRLASGKPDYAALVRLAAATDPTPQARPADVAGLYAAVLGRTVGGDDSFVSLGGDSLSYVETSLRLERLLGRLPAGWHLMPVRELEGLDQSARRSSLSRSRPFAGFDPSTGSGRRRLNQRESRDRRGWLRLRTVETNVLLRAAAIFLIVGSHSNLFMFTGGAHLLLGVVGYNFARFQLTSRPRRERLVSLRTSIIRIVVPSVIWLTFAALTSWKYGPLNVLLLNGVFGSESWTESWHYWFIEALVWTLVAMTLLVAVPAFDRAERRWPFWVPIGLATAALLTRYDVVRIFDGDYIHRAHVIFWLFALGWAAARATTHRHRLLVSAMTVATVPGFFPGDQVAREAVIVVGMLLLVWVPTMRVPDLVARAGGVLAAASLYIYLVHWQIYPAYEFELPWLATALSLLAGVAYWQVVTRATPYVARGRRLARREIRDNPRWLSPGRYLNRDQRTAPAQEASRR